jgi:hypothetical protein
MISLLKQYKRSLFWFISGLVMAVIVSFGISHQQPATAQQAPAALSAISEFAASHQEANFYQ